MPARKAVSKKKKKKAATKKTAARKKAAKKKSASRSQKKPASRKKTSAKKKASGKKAKTRRTKTKTSGTARKKAAKKAASRKTTKAGKAASRKTVKTKKAAAKKSASKKSPARKTATKKKPAVRVAATRGKTKATERARPQARRTPAAIHTTELKAGTNLLNGPLRGFRPYQPKRGEDYMSDGQLAHFREILLAWKRELMEEVDRTVLHMKDDAANFPDPNDRATQESEFGLELRTRDRERKLLRKIDSAIARIDDGSYGYCEETGDEIGLRRLEARPVATLCVEAQERRELAERQFRDREDYYR